MGLRILVALENRIDEKLVALKGELTEAIRDSETKLLTAFYSFTQTVQSGFRKTTRPKRL